MLIDVLKNVFISNFQYLQNEEKSSKVISLFFHCSGLKKEIIEIATFLIRDITKTDLYTHFLEYIIQSVAKVYSARYRHVAKELDSNAWTLNYSYKKGKFEQQVTKALVACIAALKDLQDDYAQTKEIAIHLNDLLTRIESLPEKTGIAYRTFERFYKSIVDLEPQFVALFLLGGNSKSLLRFHNTSTFWVGVKESPLQTFHSDWECDPLPKQIGTTNFRSNDMRAFDTIVEKTPSFSARQISESLPAIPERICRLIARLC